MEERAQRLEKDIHRLKTRYDQYFLGVERRPPEKLANDVAREVRFFSTTRMINTALRFKVQQLIARYNTFLTYWQKNLKDMEEGRTPRRRVHAMPGGAEAAIPGGVEISTKGADRNGMEQLFQAVSREYRKRGGKAPEMSRVREMVEKQNQVISERFKAEKVSYQVVTEGGKVRIKATPVGGRKI